MGNKQKPAHAVSQSNGFTIVELLIVIVVIGVLAAITVVAYNGVQKRASNAQQATAAKGYAKLFKQYQTLNGGYPTESGCLGNNNFDTDSDGDKDCNDNGNVAVDSALLAKLSTVGTLPDVVTKQITGADGVKRGGIRFAAGTAVIYYFLDGNDAVCDIGLRANKGASGDSVWCTTYLD
jgi:prepilin-type N-terminal cleavage/methylation domain-containing protein